MTRQLAWDTKISSKGFLEVRNVQLQIFYRRGDLRQHLDFTLTSITSFSLNSHLLVYSRHRVSSNSPITSEYVQSSMYQTEFFVDFMYESLIDNGGKGCHCSCVSRIIGNMVAFINMILITQATDAVVGSAIIVLSVVKSIKKVVVCNVFVSIS